MKANKMFQIQSLENAEPTVYPVGNRRQIERAEARKRAKQIKSGQKLRAVAVARTERQAAEPGPVSAARLATKARKQEYRYSAEFRIARRAERAALAALRAAVARGNR